MKDVDIVDFDFIFVVHRSSFILRGSLFLFTVDACCFEGIDIYYCYYH